MQYIACTRQATETLFSYNFGSTTFENYVRLYSLFGVLVQTLKTEMYSKVII